MKRPAKYPSPASVKPFMTHVPDRYPESKLHANLGQAKNAVGYERTRGARGGQIFTWDEDAKNWKVLYTVRPGTLHNDLPWNRPATGTRRWVTTEVVHKKRRVYVDAETETEARKLFEEANYAATDPWVERPSEREWRYHGVDPA